MPDIGDIVIYYTHSHSDGHHSTRDFAAIVTMIGSNDSLFVKVFENGTPPYDAVVSEFSEAEYDEQGNPIYGQSYWREQGTEAPDFEDEYKDGPPKTLEPSPIPPDEPPPVTKPGDKPASFSMK